MSLEHLAVSGRNAVLGKKKNKQTDQCLHYLDWDIFEYLLAKTGYEFTEIGQFFPLEQCFSSSALLTSWVRASMVDGPAH